MEINNNNDNEEMINYYNFNEDSSCISIGTKNGFKIILCEPFDSHYEYNFGMGIGIIEIYKSSNILALTGCENNSKFPENKLIIWDDNKKEIIKELRLISKIRIVKIINNYLFLVNDIKIYIFNFPTLTLHHSFEIYSYKKELISFSVNSDIKIAFLKNREKIYIKRIKFNKNSKPDILLCNKDNELPILFLQFNTKGNILAVACKGIIYLYNTKNCDLIREINNDFLNHGNINCIKFNNDDNFLAVSTVEKNNGRINVFDIGKEKETSIFSFFIKEQDECFNYYEFNFGDFLFAFDYNNNIIVFTIKGEFFKLELNQKGEKCKLIKNKNIFI